MGRAIVVHGGAGRHRADTLDAKVDVTEQAAEAGWRVLAGGGSAMDAVEAATCVLEADPRFDAGVGSYLNEDGEAQLDAIIVDGRTLRFGAVAAVERVRHPVTLARHVMSDSPHAMLVGRGAERFARRLGLTVPAVELITPETLEVWRRCHEDPSAIDAASGPGDTVGAVARDAAGHVAAATSTGGTKNKWVGRVGDSPIIGSGAWADDEAGAISCTGHGESIMRVCLAAAAGERLRGGQPAMAAAEWAVRRLQERTEGLGGLIVLDAAGGVGWAWNTESMPYAWRSDAGAGRGRGATSR